MELSSESGKPFISPENRPPQHFLDLDPPLTGSTHCMVPPEMKLERNTNVYDRGMPYLNGQYEDTAPLQDNLPVESPPVSRREELTRIERRLEVFLANSEADGKPDYMTRMSLKRIRASIEAEPVDPPAQELTHPEDAVDQSPAMRPEHEVYDDTADLPVAVGDTDLRPVAVAEIIAMDVLPERAVGPDQTLADYRALDGDTYTEANEGLRERTRPIIQVVERQRAETTQVERENYDNIGKAVGQLPQVAGVVPDGKKAPYCMLVTEDPAVARAFQSSTLWVSSASLPGQDTRPYYNPSAVDAGWHPHYIVGMHIPEGSGRAHILLDAADVSSTGTLGYRVHSPSALQTVSVRADTARALDNQLTADSLRDYSVEEIESLLNRGELHIEAGSPRSYYISSDRIYHPRFKGPGSLEKGAVRAYGGRHRYNDERIPENHYRAFNIDHYLARLAARFSGGEWQRDNR